VFVDCIK